MLLIALLYLLLCMPVTMRASVSLCDAQSVVQVSVRALGVSLRFDGVLRQGTPYIVPRYGRAAKKKRLKKIKRTSLRAAQPLLRAVLSQVQCIQLQLHARVGLREAWSTAVTAGAIQAAASALMACMKRTPSCDVRVEPDFCTTGLLLSGRCIFSVLPGNLMYAVIKAAVKKTQEEGFGWSSIPSRA